MKIYGPVPRRMLPWLTIAVLLLLEAVSLMGNYY